MISIRRDLVRTIQLLVVLTTTACLAAQSAPANEVVVDDRQAEQWARAVLQESGVTGGLVIHVGCGEGELASALGRHDRFRVLGLDKDPANVTAARRRCRTDGLSGNVVIETWNGGHIPCIDNAVNLLIIEDPAAAAQTEVMRVLCPRGVAFTKEGEKWQKTVKPWPDEIDQWTHYLHGPDNNAVAADTLIGAPYHVQWIGGPKWARHHNHLSSTSAMVSAGGRFFAIVDEGPAASLAIPADWKLVARDAFNGIVLWKKPIGPWEGVLRPFRSGPVDLARRLVAIGDRVYVTPGYQRPITALDAATGELIREYSDTADTVEFLCTPPRLFVVAGQIDEGEYEASRRRGLPSPAPHEKRIMAIDTESGSVAWQKSDQDTLELLPGTLCVSEGRLFFHNPRHLLCLDARTGEEIWRVARPLQIKRLAWSAPTLVAQDGVVLSADRAATSIAPTEATQIQWQVTPKTADKAAAMGELVAYAAQDGSELWRCPTALGYNSPPDVLVSNGLVWTGLQPGHNTEDFTEGRDLKTGEVKRRFNTDFLFSVAHHHRCYRNKATDRFLLLGRTGVELIDLEHGELTRNCWVRGGCQYGVMPANGLVYAPPHSCACYIQSKISGFFALSSSRQKIHQVRSQPDTGGRILFGPAYEDIADPAASGGELHEAAGDDWPVFRHDPARTGRSAARVPAQLKLAWQSQIGGRLSSPVVAGGMLLVASIDDHTVHALNVDSGQQVWERVVGGRVDSPPTIDSGLALFGCADGHVYCLRLADGELVWRFRAAPTDLRLVSHGQIESVWPVTGSVLVREGRVYCTAGRSSFLDGGMYLLQLDLRTGKLLTGTRFDDRDPQSGRQKEETIEDVELPGALPDVLVDDGRYIYLRDKVLDHDGVEQDIKLPHLYCSAGLLDDNWWHRTSWLWGERNWGRASGWAVMPGIRPSGRILVTDEETVFGYGRKRVQGSTLAGYHLFRANKKVQELDRTIKNNNVALTAHQKPARVTYLWSREVPVVARAMALTEQVLFAAGPMMAPGDAGNNEPTFEPDAQAILMAFRTDDGQELDSQAIPAQPVFDGMALAGSRLFMSTVDGNIVCYAPPGHQSNQ